MGDAFGEVALGKGGGEGWGLGRGSEGHSRVRCRVGVRFGGEAKLAGLWCSRCEAIELRGQDAPAVREGGMRVPLPKKAVFGSPGVASGSGDRSATRAPSMISQQEAQCCLVHRDYTQHKHLQGCNDMSLKQTSVKMYVLYQCFSPEYLVPRKISSYYCLAYGTNFPSHKAYPAMLGCVLTRIPQVTPIPRSNQTQDAPLIPSRLVKPRLLRTQC